MLRKLLKKRIKALPLLFFQWFSNSLPLRLPIHYADALPIAVWCWVDSSHIFWHVFHSCRYFALPTPCSAAAFECQCLSPSMLCQLFSLPTFCCHFALRSYLKRLSAVISARSGRVVPTHKSSQNTRRLQTREGLWKETRWNLEIGSLSRLLILFQSRGMEREKKLGRKFNPKI